ncbi:hypothetical protein RUM44_005831 [Polyplax serrata]|uniref:Chorein N-terminal domain-containing protein n=1 Tax=Polyplax serrata TaxID=468196 RepID=A0ABR1AYT5_POLSC
MVFEAVVVELLNRFLNQYVENLDTSQLKIGIWGGDVVLNDLKIKTTLFDDLNLPARVKWGKLGKLAMKIPWKNLYGSQVVVDIEELLVVLIPSNEFKYDAVKEEKWSNEKKQARLRAVEEARKREQDIEPIKQSGGFVEKLVTQIIKNIQIVIRNIHIRYEDKTTNPKSAFSVGVTMSNLSATTTTKESSQLPESSSNGCDNSNFICKAWNPK